MNNIFMIIGHENGSEIVYSVHDEIKIKSSKYKSSYLIYELGKMYHRPVHSTMKLIERKYGYHQKVPVFIEANRFLFFPTLSMKDPLCCWINYYCVREIRKVKDATVLSFYNHSLIHEERVQWSYRLDMDKRVIRKQMNRCYEIHHQYRHQPDRILQLVNLEQIDRQ